MSFEDDTPTHAGHFAAESHIVKWQTDELATNSFCLTFLRIHFSVDVSGNLVIGDIVSL